MAFYAVLLLAIDYMNSLLSSLRYRAKPYWRCGDGHGFDDIFMKRTGDSPSFAGDIVSPDRLIEIERGKAAAGR